MGSLYGAKYPEMSRINWVEPAASEDPQRVARFLDFGNSARLEPTKRLAAGSDVIERLRAGGIN